jgi:PAP2 superfamily
LQNARLFALLDLAMADGNISCWDAKYNYSSWRPITAIRLASTDGNPFTVQDDNWTSSIVTPAYPEYFAGHATISGAAQAVLTLYFGNHVPVQGWSEAFGPSYVRSFPNFSAAADEVSLARIWGGIHFRTAVVTGRVVGDLIGVYVTFHAARPLHEFGDDHDCSDQGSHRD